ncbi:MAG: long-chain-fatty-acid--CoA ligase [Ilumatobacteraceae bacterium]
MVDIPFRHGTLDTPIRRARTVARDEIALIDGDIRRTYGELSDRVERLRGGLLTLGLSSGDRVAGLALNSAAHFEAWTAIPTANLVFNDLNFRLAPSELAFIVDDSGARILCADATNWEVANDLIERCDSLERLVWMDHGPSPDGAITWDELATHDPALVPGDLDADRPAALVYTGGTTGRPKGVIQTHGNLMVNAKHMLWANPLFRDDRFLHLTPMFHSAGVANMYAQMLVAGTHVICPGFDPDLVGRMIEEHRITVCVLVPTMINMFVNHPATAERDLSSWRSCFYAASPIPSALLARAMTELPCDFFQAYGMTEMSPHCCQLGAEDHRRGIAGDDPVATRRLTSCGTPCIGVDVEIRRADGTVCDTDEVGEITVRGPNMMPGYWNRPEETAAVFTDDGWYRTGDLGSMDDGGYVYVVDRAKDMIVSGGENVFTTEVEQVLASHPAVLELAVFGIPDDRWGERVHAEVVPKAGTTVTAEELIAHCRERIAGFKTPRTINLRDEPLPKSGAGKILKRELRAPYWAGHDRAVG